MGIKKIMDKLHLNKQETVEIVLEILIALSVSLFYASTKLVPNSQFDFLFITMAAFFMGMLMGVRWQIILLRSD